MRRSSSEGAVVQTPRPGPPALVRHGGRQREGADGAADRTRRGGRGHVVLPPQDVARGPAGAVYRHGSGPVGDSGFGFVRHSVEVDVVAAQSTMGGL